MISRVSVGVSSGIALHRRQPAPHAHHRRRAGGEVQVGGPAVDDLEQDLGEVKLHTVAVSEPSPRADGSASRLDLCGSSADSRYARDLGHGRES